MTQILNSLSGPEDLHQMPVESLQQLAQEIRELLVDVTSKNGGHLAPNLGVVELTIALHHYFNSPQDKIIWDVGHQSYIHKILTGRRDVFYTLRQLNGLSGFPKREESPHDVFNTGHSSTSISAALGMAIARDLNNEKHQVVAVIGDGSMTGGMAFEALNHAGHLKANLIVVLNDNEMSIAANVGALALYLSKLRLNPAITKLKEELESILRKIPTIGVPAATLADRLKYLIVPGVLFEVLGFTYIGPVDGHNIADLKRSFKTAVQKGGPILIHVLTKKGKGYPPAENDPEKFHSIGPFSAVNGEETEPQVRRSYTDVLGQAMMEIAGAEPGLIAVTAAMCLGTGLDQFAKKFPRRFFDVGIAEQHAVTLAAGLASQGFKPIVAIYSTFLQRAYDQIAHDVCMQKLPVVFTLDRSGIVGQDGPTHHGVFDFAYLRHLPNIVVSAPKDGRELRNMLFSSLQYAMPVAIRYPKDMIPDDPGMDPPEFIPPGRCEVISEGKDLLVLAVGSLVYPALEAVQAVRKQGISCTLINIRFIKPLDGKILLKWARKIPRMLTIEDHVLAGGFGSSVAEFFNENNIRGVEIHMVGLPDRFIEHGPRSLLLKQYQLTSEGIAMKIKRILIPAIGMAVKG
ncbi:MAG: 1-deoxy-D-xylulose-5-phosphate synthase [Bacillota bacterium]